MRRLSLSLGSLATACGLAACGGAETPTGPTLPDSAAMLQFLGLTPGSCFSYSFTESGIRGYATVEIDGPTDRLPYYVQNYQRAGLGGGIKTYLDPKTDGKVFIRRRIEGAGATADDRTYNQEPLPLFADLTLEKGETVYAEDTFEVTSTPSLPDGSGFRDGEPERHAWVVQAEEEVGTTEGPQMALRLSYARGDQLALMWLVPGYGFAQFTDFDNRTHSVCDARLCDAAGQNCNRPESCIAACAQ